MQQERDERPDENPELADYVPGEVGAGRRRRMQRVMRVVAILAIIGMIVPGIVSGISTATQTAALACRIVVSQSLPTAPTSAAEARFEWGGAEGPGWYCYVIGFGGSEMQLRFLGFIPEVKVVPGSPGVDV